MRDKRQHRRTPGHDNRQEFDASVLEKRSGVQQGNFGIHVHEIRLGVRKEGDGREGEGDGEGRGQERRGGKGTGAVKREKSLRETRP